MKIKTRDVPCVKSIKVHPSDAVLCTVVVLLYSSHSISSTGAEGMHFLLRRKERMNCEIKLSLFNCFLSDLFHK